MKPYHLETWVGDYGVAWLGSRWQLQRRNRIPVTGRLFSTVAGNRAVRGSRAQLLNHALWLQGLAGTNQGQASRYAAASFSAARKMGVELAVDQLAMDQGLWE